MIELVRHIEILLLENECVVIPGFGGFITHDMPASWSDEESVFLPPLRTIGFNPQLKMNDGMLVLSYMEAYNTDFPDAAKMLERAVDKLIEALHKDGKVELANIGQLSLSVYGSCIFSPYTDEIISPRFYGLDSFEIKEVKALQQSLAKADATLKPGKMFKKTYEIRLNRTLVRNAVAAVAAIVLFFYMSAPVENTYIEKGNYAQLLPADLFGKIEQQSLLTTPIVAINADHSSKTTPEEVEQDKKTTPVAVREVKVPKAEAAVKHQETVKPATKRHHIIVASVTFRDDAKVMVAELKKQGYPDACILTGDNRTRVSIGSYQTREEADRQIVEVRKNNTYKGAWLLVR